MVARPPLWTRVVLLLVGVWLVLSWWMAGQLMTPQRRAAAAAPSGPGLVSEELTLLTADGLAIAAWAVTPSEPPGAVCLLLHAMDGHRSAQRAAYLASRGLAVLALDFRGHGASQQAPTGFGWRERAEVRIAVAEARRRWPGLPLVGWGTSLGAAALVFAVDPAHDDSLPADTFSALVLESLYADIVTAFRNRVDLAAGRWALPFAQPARWLVTWRTDLDERHLAPEDSLARITAAAPVEVLLATGSLDRLSTPAEMERLAAASGGRAVLVDGGHHADLMGKDDGAWLAELRAFFQRWGGR